MGDVLSRPAEEEGQQHGSGGTVLPNVPLPAAARLPPGPHPVPSTRRRIKAKPTRIVPVSAPLPARNRTAATASSGPRRSKHMAADVPFTAGAPPAQQQQGTSALAPAAPSAGAQSRVAGFKRKDPESSTNSTGSEPDAEAMMLSRHKFLGLAVLAMGAVRSLAPFPPMPPQQQRQQQPASEEALQRTAPAPGSFRFPAAVEAAMSPDVQQAPRSASTLAACQTQQQQHDPAPMDTHEEEQQLAVAVRHEEEARLVSQQDQQGRTAEPAEQAQPAEPADVAMFAKCGPLEGEEGWQAVLASRPLSVNKPVSRSQLRQQLQLQSLRLSGVGSPAVHAAGRIVGTPPVAGGSMALHSTRGQRLLGLVRQQQMPHAAALAADGAQQPAASVLSHVEHEQAAAPLAEQLPGSPAVLPGEAVPSPQPAPGNSTPCQPQRTTPPTPATVEPSSTQRGGSVAVATAPPSEAGNGNCSPSPLSPAPRMASLEAEAPSPVTAEAAVQTALQQVDNLLADLRADSPQPSNWQVQGGRVTKPSSRRREDEVEKLLKQAAVDSHAAAAPASMPEVSSRPCEAGGDNFPGFWRQPVPGSQPANAAQGKRPVEHDQAVGSGQERARRVRFSMPETEEAEGVLAAAAASLPEQQQQDSGLTPLVVAAPVLPASAGWAAEARPGTPAKAKPALLPMPQPPAYSRFGAASFRRGGYAGPAARRQALVTFVSDNGAPCFAIPLGVLAGTDGEAEAEAQPAVSGIAEELTGGGGSAPSGGADLVIPRRLQHREGLRRRRGMHEHAPSVPQGPQLLVQEVREAYMNAKLAEHAGEPWARLDMAGCELQADGGHAAALTQVSSQLEEARGAAAVKQLTVQLKSEWLHLKHVRQYATQRAVPAAAPAIDDASLPRGILKHRSSLGGSSQLLAGVAAAATVTVAAAEPTAVEPAVQPEAAEPPTGAAQPAAVQQAAEVRCTAAVDPRSFEAVLAADVAYEELPLLPSTEPAPTAAVVQPAPAVAPVAAALAAQPAGDHEGAVPMNVDAPAQGSPMPAAQHAAVGMPLPAAAHAPAAVGDPAAADWAAPGEGGEPAWDMTPRPVKLTPGPELSRGAKLLQRLGTPVAATKIQQLLACAAGVQGRKAGSSPFQQVGPVRLLSAVGGVSSVHRRGMSRGERLLASVRSSGTEAGGVALPAAAPPPGEPADGRQVAAASLPEEGPAIAAASCLLNT